MQVSYFNKIYTSFLFFVILVCSSYAEATLKQCSAWDLEQYFTNNPSILKNMDPTDKMALEEVLSKAFYSPNKKLSYSDEMWVEKFGLEKAVEQAKQEGLARLAKQKNQNNYGRGLKTAGVAVPLAIFSTWFYSQYISDFVYEEDLNDEFHLNLSGNEQEDIQFFHDLLYCDPKHKMGKHRVKSGETMFDHHILSDYHEERFEEFLNRIFENSFNQRKIFRNLKLPLSSSYEEVDFSDINFRFRQRALLKARRGSVGLSTEGLLFSKPRIFNKAKSIQDIVSLAWIVEKDQFWLRPYYKSLMSLTINERILRLGEELIKEEVNSYRERRSKLFVEKERERSQIFRKKIENQIELMNKKISNLYRNLNYQGQLIKAFASLILLQRDTISFVKRYGKNTEGYLQLKYIWKVGGFSLCSRRMHESNYPIDSSVIKVIYGAVSKMSTEQLRGLRQLDKYILSNSKSNYLPIFKRPGEGNYFVNERLSVNQMDVYLPYEKKLSNVKKRDRDFSLVSALIEVLDRGEKWSRQLGWRSVNYNPEKGMRVRSRAWLPISQSRGDFKKEFIEAGACYYVDDCYQTMKTHNPIMFNYFQSIWPYSKRKSVSSQLAKLHSERVSKFLTGNRKKLIADIRRLGLKVEDWVSLSNAGLVIPEQMELSLLPESF